MRKVLKKTTALLLAGAMAAAMAGCGDSQEATHGDETTKAVEQSAGGRRR